MTELARALAPDPVALAIAVAIDLIVGDPVYPAHPVRLIGRTLHFIVAGIKKAPFVAALDQSCIGSKQR